MSGITINGDNVFFIVGGQRCGTTYLYNLLEKHPSICLAKPSFPHPKYFINQDKKDINYLNYFSKYLCNYRLHLLVASLFPANLVLTVDQLFFYQ